MFMYQHAVIAARSSLAERLKIRLVTVWRWLQELRADHLKLSSIRVCTGRLRRRHNAAPACSFGLNGQPLGRGVSACASAGAAAGMRVLRRRRPRRHIQRQAELLRVVRRQSRSARVCQLPLLRASRSRLAAFAGAGAAPTARPPARSLCRLCCCHSPSRRFCSFRIRGLGLLQGVLLRGTQLCDARIQPFGEGPVDSNTNASRGDWLT